MWTEEKIINYLRQNLKPKRFQHSIGVRDTAIKLAEIYGEDLEKARIAGLLHDCAKNMSDEQILDICLKNEYNIDRKSTRLNSSHANISYAVFCLKKNKNNSTTYKL